jgi:hypothetical protein
LFESARVAVIAKVAISIKQINYKFQLGET